ncbi:hypothetical protein M514_08313 [Trichuris suis]|uniref:Peptidase S1 domain-containing protein n=1 Tax=Trichuris suis TaxID=68888 RepID=A0A085NGE8_9BILA|nr:hypothetical protein M513_08313 [Trichuris suis]KFD68544.1 hypothetical protein M514_08313 [Trichuris suis]
MQFFRHSFSLVAVLPALISQPASPRSSRKGCLEWQSWQNYNKHGSNKALNAIKPLSISMVNCKFGSDMQLTYEDSMFQILNGDEITRPSLNLQRESEEEEQWTHRKICARGAFGSNRDPSSAQCVARLVGLHGYKPLHPTNFDRDLSCQLYLEPSSLGPT